MITAVLDLDQCLYGKIKGKMLPYMIGSSISFSLCTKMYCEIISEEAIILEKIMWFKFLDGSGFGLGSMNVPNLE